jgi:trehalose/maltose hydrolase-like predicted phosphorylase
VGKTQLIKQADVVMMLYLLWDQFTPEQRRSNFDYYELRTVHGSSLSPAIYALMAVRAGRMEAAVRYFRMAAEIDLFNNMGNASGGIHAAAQGGLWQAVVFGFAGMRLRPDGLAFDPRLPDKWQALRFHVKWKGRTLACCISPRMMETTNLTDLALTVQVGTLPPSVIQAGECRRWELTGDGTRRRPGGEKEGLWIPQAMPNI